MVVGSASGHAVESVGLSLCPQDEEQPPLIWASQKDSSRSILPRRATIR